MNLVKKIFLSLLLSVLAFSLFPREASAHATPVLYQPEASAVLEKTPERIIIRFSERVEAKASSITVYSSNGDRIDLNDARTNPEDSHIYSIGIKDGGQGTYAVSWQVISADDGHFTKGAFIFSVGKESVVNTPASQNQFQIQHSSALPEAITIWLELLGQALLIGALVVTMFIWRPLRKRLEIAFDKELQKRFSMVTIVGVILVLTGTISYLVLKSAELQQLQQISLLQAFSTFATTVAGQFTVYRLVLAVIFFLVFLQMKKNINQNQRITKAELLLFGLVLAMALARARVSHAAASHILPEFSVFVNFVHLVFKDLWVGGIAAIVFIILPILKRLKDTSATQLSFTSLSKILSIAFGVAGITGAYIVWLHLKSPENLFSTDWGIRFIVLSVFGASFLTLRLFHQLIAERKLRNFLSWLPVTLPLEMIVGITLLFMTSFLIITTPPLSSKPVFEQKIESQNAEVTFSEHPFESDNFLISVEDRDRKHLVQNIVVTLTNSEKSIGPIVVETEKRFEGGYVFSKSNLSPPGNWKVEVSAQRQNLYDATGDFSINYPQDLELSKSDEEKLDLNLFTIIVLANALGIAIFAIFLYKFSSKLNKKTATLTQVSTIRRDNAREGITPVLLSLFIALCFLFVIWVAYTYFLRSDFQKNCERNGHFWNQTVPQRFGKAISNVAVTGCSLGSGVGQFHFADEREYSYFMRPVEVATQIQTNPQTLTTDVPATLTYSIVRPDGRPEEDLLVEHDRILHTIIISEDFSTFAHIHPEDFAPITDEIKREAKYTAFYTFPKAGRYIVAADFNVRARHLSEKFIVEVTGEPSMQFTQKDLTHNKFFGEYQVELSVPAQVKTRKPAVLTYTIKKDAKPVEDLEVYLGAAMHLAIVREDLSQFLHTHGELPRPFFEKLLSNQGPEQHIHTVLPSRFGPKIEAYVVFPEKGLYHVFGEFQHEDKTIVTDFVVAVE